MASNRGNLRRVPLPSYPFERQSYWIEAPRGDAAGAVAVNRAIDRRELADWFYVPVWQRTDPVVPYIAADQGGVLLMLGDPRGVGRRMLERLRAAGRLVVCVGRGAQFRQLDADRFELRPAERSDFEQLLRAVEVQRGLVTDACHLWSLDEAGIPAHADALDHGFYALLALVQALDTVKPPAGVRQVAITVVANQVEDVSGTEPLCPEKATLQGPCKVIPQEYPKLSCRLIDVVLPVGDDETDRLAHQVVAEMHTTSAGSTVAYRGPHRWIKGFEPARRDIPVAQRLRKQGVYLITGGLGGIGLTLAKHLARHWQARLVLVGRTALPPREQWPAMLAAGEDVNDQGVKLARLLELESFGAEVVVLQADVADAHQMHKVIETARRRFGAVHGVIHAAGHAGGGVIALRTRSSVEQVFSSKVRGTQTLLESVAGETLDFVLLCSSLASLAGGLGKVDYAAANAFMDAVAAVTQRTSGRMVVSVNWDGWREVGMAAGMRLSERVGIEPDQGALAFERIVNGPSLSQSIVSTTDLAARLTMTDDDVLAAAVMTPTNEAASRHHPRPPLSTTYVAPVGDLEDRIASIWCEALGISAVGVQDNLFELGGDSLLAIQLLARVRSVYGTNLQPAVFFKEPTIAALAVVVETQLIEEIEQADRLVSVPADASVSA